MSDRIATMSDNRLSFRLSAKLRTELRRRAKLLNKSESQVVRDIIEKDLDEFDRPRTIYDTLAETGFLGCIPDAPPGLSTDKKYMEGFGEWDSDAHRRRPVSRAGREVRARSSKVR